MVVNTAAAPKTIDPKKKKKFNTLQYDSIGGKCKELWKYRGDGSLTLKGCGMWGQRCVEVCEWRKLRWET